MNLWFVWGFIWGEEQGNRCCLSSITCFQAFTEHATKRNAEHPAHSHFHYKHPQGFLLLCNFCPPLPPPPLCWCLVPSLYCFSRQVQIYDARACICKGRPWLVVKSRAVNLSWFLDAAAWKRGERHGVGRKGCDVEKKKARVEGRWEEGRQFCSAWLFCHPSFILPSLKIGVTWTSLMQIRLLFSVFDPSLGVSF